MGIGEISRPRRPTNDNEETVMSVRDADDLEAAFLREIAHNPHDETAVLVYADWLSEQDDLASVSRGEFLRLESILKRGKPGAARSDLEWQARQLWWDHVEEWLGPLYHAVDHFRYERGLLSVETSEQTLMGIDLDELASAPAWDWVRHLGVRKGGLETLALLSEIPPPAFLMSVGIGRKTIEDVAEDLPLLLGTSILHGLKELDLSENAIGDAGCAQLSAWAPAGSLRKLTLRSAQIGCAGVFHLTESPHLGGLEELDLSSNLIQDRGGSALARTKGLARLAKLDVSGNEIDWHTVAALQKRYGDGVAAYPGRPRNGYGY
jgi:uncharacterized protein (TIGR02996 family)